MKLLPSLKPKKRYILFEIISNKTFQTKVVEDAVLNAIKEFIGILGVAKVAPMFVKEKFKDNKFVLKVGHKFTDEIKSALILVKEIKNEQVIIKSVVTSGTLKKVSGYL
jgi:RNase P/RNase MRP subunit POP5